MDRRGRSWFGFLFSLLLLFTVVLLFSVVLLSTRTQTRTHDLDLVIVQTLQQVQAVASRVGSLDVAGPVLEIFGCHITFVHPAVVLVFSFWQDQDWEVLDNLAVDIFGREELVGAALPIVQDSSHSLTSDSACVSKDF